MPIHWGRISKVERAEPLQPEAFLQDHFTASSVQVHPVDFARTEVRFVPGQARPCVRSIYFKCAPSLAQRPAFNQC